MSFSVSLKLVSGGQRPKVLLSAQLAAELRLESLLSPRPNLRRALREMPDHPGLRCELETHLICSALGRQGW